MVNADFILPSGSGVPSKVVILRSNGTTLYYTYYENGKEVESQSKYYASAKEPTEFHGVNFYMANSNWTVKASKSCRAVHNGLGTQDGQIKKYSPGEQIAAWRYTDGMNQVTAFV